MILSQIGQVLAAEAPISKNLLGKRVLNAWGIARMGARLERRLDEILAVGRFKKTKSHQMIFYWDKEQLPEDYELFRVPNGDGMRRDMEDIQRKKSPMPLSTFWWTRFGFARGSAGMEEIIKAGIKMGVKRGYVTVDDGGRDVVKE